MARGKTETSMSVREIANGVIITKTESGPRTYKQTETYLPKMPAEMARMMKPPAAKKPSTPRARGGR